MLSMHSACIVMYMHKLINNLRPIDLEIIIDFFVSLVRATVIRDTDCSRRLA